MAEIQNVAAKQKVIVVGCGVSGLTCAIRLCEAGYPVEIWAREVPPDTTSNIAGAIWYPYLAQPQELVARWSAVGYAEFHRLAAQPGIGVAVRHCLEILQAPVGDPWWSTLVSSYRRATPAELPAGYLDGYVYTAPTIDTPVYLSYLVGRFEGLGGRICRRNLKHAAEAFPSAPIVVNCSGLGARELVGDRTIYAIQGQTVEVSRMGIDSVLFDQHGPRGLAHVIPRATTCILGGTHVDRAEGTEPDPEVEKSILQRCAALEPRLRGAAVLSSRVGLRPGRPTVRLEAERWPGANLLVHNYGHGGAGVTLSWGCAADVVGLIENR